MKTFQIMVTIGITATLLLTSLPLVARAIPPGGGAFSFGGELRGATKIAGRIVCSGCTINEVRAAHPELPRLYQLRHRNGQLVMTVQSVSEPARWDAIVGLSTDLTVRASSALLHQLGAEENLFKEVVILGLLRSSRTLDVGEVRFAHPRTTE